MWVNRLEKTNASGTENVQVGGRRRRWEDFPMHLIKCLFLLQQICQLNAARIVGKTLTKNVTDENNPSWNLSTTQRKIAFPLRTHARTNAPEYLARFVAAEICGQRIRPAQGGPYSQKKETEGASACRRSLSRWRIATRKATSRPRGGGGMLGVAFLTRFCFISGRHKLPTSSASHSFISTYFLLLFSICLCQRVQSRRGMELELGLGLAALGIRLEWHIIWWCFSRFFRTWVPDFY